MISSFWVVFTVSPSRRIVGICGRLMPCPRHRRQYRTVNCLWWQLTIARFVTKFDLLGVHVVPCPTPSFSAKVDGPSFRHVLSEPQFLWNMPLPLQSYFRHVIKIVRPSGPNTTKHLVIGQLMCPPDSADVSETILVEYISPPSILNPKEPVLQP